MQHVFLFLYLFVILTGVVSVAIAGLVYVRTRNRLLSRYISYISNLTLFIFFYLFILLYLNLNVPGASFYMQLLIVALALLSCFSLMYTIPRFTHALVRDERTGRMDLYAGILAGIALVLMILSFRVDLTGRTLSQDRNIWMYASLALFFLPIVYSVVLKAASLGRLDGERRKIVGNIALLNAIFLPGVVFDLYLFLHFRIFAFTPVLYCSSCILFTRYIARRYSRGLASMSSGLDEEAIDPILGRTGISSREKEVILLISKGLGNREIADRLFISPNTVKTHNRNIFQKMGVRSRFELLARLHEGAADRPLF